MIQKHKKSYSPSLSLILATALMSAPAISSAAVFDVNTTTDAVDNNIGDGTCAASNGDCTLRAAIQEANGLAGADTINLPAGNYLLTVQNTDEDAAADGDLDITSDVNIVGADRDTTIIDADYTNRIFHILKAPTGERPYTVSLSNIKIMNGSETDVSGGGIRNFGSLTLQNVLLIDNEVKGSRTAGGALFSAGKTTITDSEIKNNKSIGYGGGIYIANGTLLSLTNSIIKSNTSAYGGGIYAWYTDVELRNSTIEENAARYGGGLSLHSRSVHFSYAAEMINTTFNQNTAAYNGGGGAVHNDGYRITIKDSAFTKNSVDWGTGGAIYNGNSNPRVAIGNSLFSQNSTKWYAGAITGNNFEINTSKFIGNSTTGDGGAVHIGNSRIFNSEFSGNSAEGNGGAIHISGASSIYNSLVNNNAAKYGGGILVSHGDTSLDTSTVSGNTSSSSGGGIYTRNSSSVTLTITNSTIAFNDSATSEGSNIWHAAPADNLSVKSTIISDPISGQNCGGNTADSGGSNIDSDGSCGLDKPNDQNSVDPLLVALADNGGFTNTHVLGLGSSAIDEGSPSACLDTDQRLFARDALCDVGAFEANASGLIAAGEVAYEQASFEVSENNGIATITVSRINGSAGAVSVDYYQPAGGSATRYVDYTAVAGTLSWIDGNTDSKTIEITLIDDAAEEGPETVLLGLQNFLGGVTSGVNSSAVLTLLDDDVQPGELSFSTTAYSVNEDAGTITLTVNRDNGSFGETSVEVVTGNQNDTATVTEDYTSKSEVVTFADGETSKTVTITILDDNIAESDESFAVSLQNATNGATINSGSTDVTIKDNEVVAIPAKLAFELSSYVVNEPDGTVQLTVVRTENSSGGVSVNYATSSDSASSNDFTANSGTLTFADGVNEQTIDIAVTNDSTDESDETFTVTLSNASSGVEFGNITTATVTIKDDDNPTAQIDEIQFQQATYTVDESAGTVQLTIVRSGNNGGEVSVDYATDSGTANVFDYNHQSGTLIFANGVNTQTIDITIDNDIFDESDEEFSVTLSGASSGAELGLSTVATVTIIDDDTTSSNDPGTSSSSSGGGGPMGPWLLAALFSIALFRKTKR